MTEQHGSGVVQDEQGNWVTHWHSSNGKCFYPSGSSKNLCQLGCPVGPPACATDRGN